ncbi:MAG TPA: hypothetical protein VFI91_06495 [Longimicrobiaceae bacterium]|nr:hypothetical protein [Longimicrobiaceae bacterium]
METTARRYQTPAAPPPLVNHPSTDATARYEPIFVGRRVFGYAPAAIVSLGWTGLATMRSRR